MKNEQSNQPDLSNFSVEGSNFLPFSLERVVLSLIDDLSDGIFVVDAFTGLIVFGNQIAHQMNGWGYPTLIWKSIDLVNGRKAPYVERIAYVEELKKNNGHIQHRKHVHIHKSGRLIYLDVSVTLKELEAVPIYREYLPVRYRENEAFLKKYFKTAKSNPEILKPLRNPLKIIQNEIDKDDYILASDRHLIKTLLYRSEKRIVTCGVDRDETAEILYRQELERLATSDPLTGLANRRYFEQVLAYKLNEVTRLRRQNNLAVLFLDLDNFKKLNDAYGHDYGDKILISFGKLLKKCLRTTDLVGRFGGDEFNILLTLISSSDDVLAVTNRLFSELETGLRVDEQVVKIQTSIGVMLYNPAQKEKEITPEKLIKNADLALYQAKHEGKNRVCFYKA